MKKLRPVTAIAFLVLAASALAAPDSGAIRMAGKNAWAAVKDKKLDAFQKMLTPDFRGADAEGIMGLGQERADVRAIDFQSVKFGEMDVVFIAKGVALGTYRVTVKGAKGGRDISGNLIAASNWKREGSKWRVAFHTDLTAK